MKMLTLFLLLPLGALGQMGHFGADPNASSAAITLKTNHDVVHGTFHVQSGAIDFDRTAHTMAGSVVVGAGSGKTGNDARDAKMNKEILKVDQYSTITFAPRTFSGTLESAGDSTLQVSGVFTLLGAPHEITIPLQVHIDGSRATVKGHFILPYVQWGVKSPNFLIWKAEDTVEVDLNLSGGVS